MLSPRAQPLSFLALVTKKPFFEHIPSWNVYHLTSFLSHSSCRFLLMFPLPHEYLSELLVRDARGAGLNLYASPRLSLGVCHPAIFPQPLLLPSLFWACFLSCFTLSFVFVRVHVHLCLCRVFVPASPSLIPLFFVSLPKPQWPRDPYFLNPVSVWLRSFRYILLLHTLMLSVTTFPTHLYFSPLAPVSFVQKHELHSPSTYTSPTI